MSILPRDRWQRSVFLGFLAFFAASCIAPPHVEFLLMQHVPTLLALLLLVNVVDRLPVSRLSFGLTILFFALHTLGARYLYSYTPYDDWSKALTGRTISETFGLTRNHYDRVVHFAFGLLMSVPIQELEQRYLRLSRRIACLLAVEFVIAMSASYEMLEWLIAVVFTPTWAESFLGQQGDIFDGQKDMALATAGAVISMGLVAAILQRSGGTPRPTGKTWRTRESGCIGRGSCP